MFLLVPLLVLGCGPKTSSAKAAPNYFPVAEGARWTYRGTFNARIDHETDVAVPFTVDGQQAWMFVDEGDLGDGAAMPFAEMFGLGAYIVRPDGVLTADLMWANEATNLHIGDFQQMLALPPQVGAKIASQSDSPDRSGGWTVAEIGTVELGIGTFRDCARLDLGQGSFAWLCPDIGLVKWQFVTGRVEELEAWSIPGVSEGP